jgi:hypothetical protein
VSVPPVTNSGNLGTGAICDEVVGTISGLVCGNFVSPRTFTVNGTAVDCVKGYSGAPPASPVKGGYCMQASAGDYPYAYFQTY